MEPTVISPIIQPKRSIIPKLIIGLIVLLIVVGVGILLFFQVQHMNRESDVKNELVKQNKILSASEKNGLFAKTLPDTIRSTKKVTISVIVSGPGDNYCIEGSNKEDDSIVYHMDKKTDKTAPQKGGCSQNTEATVPPTRPDTLTVNTVTATGVVLEWKAALYAATYSVQCAKTTVFIDGLVLASFDSAQGTVTGLSENTDYFCRVAAVNKLGQSEWSNTVTIHTLLSSKVPTDLKISTVSKSAVKYSFRGVDGATSYIIQYTKDINFISNVQTITTNSLSGQIENLDAQSVYYIHVQAITPEFDASRAAFSDPIQGFTN